MRKRFHSLKKPKARADWSKWNLYNISRMLLPPAANKTFFQQKWLAKSMTRAYHGEQIREGQWTRMFDRRLPAVVPMDHRVLAKTDGSDQAAGRGSGLQKDPAKEERSSRPAKTPYMHMTYWPTERRLDTAIWRALFASSARQARQFVVHGFVRVNGKKMPFPGYLLNPGDMFSVEPERVLYGTGARKFSKNNPDSTQDQVAGAHGEEEVAEEYTDEEGNAVDEQGNPIKKPEAVEAQAQEEAAAATDALAAESPKDALRALMSRARSILSDPKDKLSGRRKEELREFSRTVKKTLSKLGATKYDVAKPLDATIDTLEADLATITSKIVSSTPSTETTSTPPPSPTASPSPPSAEATAEDTATTSPTTPDSPAPAPTPPKSSNPQMADATKPDAYNSRRDAQLLHAALARAQENPIDVRKAYATPWRPRAYMSAFAFIPRYLEVNQKICSAVYVRHPVARPGLGEVPTPFHGETMALAHNWYLRRR